MPVLLLCRVGAHFGVRVRGILMGTWVVLCWLLLWCGSAEVVMRRILLPVCLEYPLRRLAVTRYRCSAGGAGGMGFRHGGASSGCGSAGSLRLLGAVRVVEVVAGCCEAGPVLG